MRTISEDRAALRKNRPAGSHRHTLSKSKIHDGLAILDGEAIGKERDRLWRILRHCSEGTFKLVAGPCREIVGAQAKLPCVLLRIVALKMLAGMRGVGDNGNTTQIRNDVAQEF